MHKLAMLARIFVGGLVLWLLLSSGAANAQSSGSPRSVLLAPGARCTFLVECSQFDEIGLHIGTGVALRTDSTRSHWDAQGALRLSLTALDLAELGVAFAGHLSSDGGNSPRLSSSPVSLYARLRLLPLRLGPLAWSPLRLALTYQHDLVADPFGQNEPPGVSRGTLRLVAGQSLGRVDIDGGIGFVLAQLNAAQPHPVAFDLSAAASVWLWRGTDQAPADEFRLTAEALARFSLDAAFPSEQNLLMGFLGQSAKGYGGGIALGTQVLDQQAGFLALARLQVSWGKRHNNPWAERKAAEPDTTPEFIWKLLGAIDPVLGADGCVWTDPTPERPSSKWFCIGTPAADDRAQIVLKDGKRLAVGTHLWELGASLRLDDGRKVAQIPLSARLRKAVWDYLDENERDWQQNREKYRRQVCEGQVSILHGAEKSPGLASQIMHDDAGSAGALLGEEILRQIYCNPNPSLEDQALMTLNVLGAARTRGPLRSRPPLAARAGDVTETKAPVAMAVGTRGSAPASSFARTHSLSGGASSRLVDSLTESMKAKGWMGKPIKAVEHNGQLYVINGHHRIEAARRANIEVQYEIIGPDEMATYNYKSMDDVLRATSEAGPNRLRR